MSWTCGWRRMDEEKKVIIEGDCRSQSPAAVFSPSVQGAGPGSIPLSQCSSQWGCSRARPQESLIPARWWRWNAAQRLRCCCSLAGLVQLLQRLYVSAAGGDITSQRANDGAFDRVDAILPTLGGWLFCQRTFMFRGYSPICNTVDLQQKDVLYTDIFVCIYMCVYIKAEKT